MPWSLFIHWGSVSSQDWLRHCSHGWRQCLSDPQCRCTNASRVVTLTLKMKKQTQANLNYFCCTPPLRKQAWTGPGKMYAQSGGSIYSSLQGAVKRVWIERKFPQITPWKIICIPLVGKAHYLHINIHNIQTSLFSRGFHHARVKIHGPGDLC